MTRKPLAPTRDPSTCPHACRGFALPDAGAVPWRCRHCGARGRCVDLAAFDRETAASIETAKRERRAA